MNIPLRRTLAGVLLTTLAAGCAESIQLQPSIFIVGIDNSPSALNDEAHSLLTKTVCQDVLGKTKSYDTYSLFTINGNTTSDYVSPSAAPDLIDAKRECDRILQVAETANTFICPVITNINRAIARSDDDFIPIVILLIQSNEREQVNCHPDLQLLQESVAQKQGQTFIVGSTNKGSKLNVTLSQYDFFFTSRATAVFDEIDKIRDRHVIETPENTTTNSTTTQNHE